MKDKAFPCVCRGTGRRSRLPDTVISLLCALLWIGVWWGAALLVGLPVLLPSPADTVRALIRLGGTADFWEGTGITLLRVTGGFCGAVAAGSGFALLCHFYPFAERLLSPLRSFIRCTPVVSFIMLLWLWLDKNAIPVFIGFLMVMPVIWSNMQEGLASADPLLIEMGRAYRLRPARMLREIWLPAAHPSFTAACAAGIGLAWKSGISAEVIARPLRAIGTGIADAKVYLETEELFARTLVIVVLSLLLEKVLVKGLLKRKETDKPAAKGEEKA